MYTRSRRQKSFLSNLLPKKLLRNFSNTPHRRISGRGGRSHANFGSRSANNISVLSLRRLKNLFFKISVFAAIILIFAIAWQVFRPGIRVRVSPETVAAFRVPHRAIGMLQNYSEEYGIPFAELFAVFNAENDFFPEKSAVYDLSVLNNCM